jgi:hypothetical protein
MKYVMVAFAEGGPAMQPMGPQVWNAETLMPVPGAIVALAELTPAPIIGE